LRAAGLAGAAFAVAAFAVAGLRAAGLVVGVFAGAATARVALAEAVPCVFPGAVTDAEAAAVREVAPGACERALRVPVAGGAPSVVRRSGWSEVMHLASVGDCARAVPGKRRREPCKHAVIVS
jgi:hypothetical protein